MSTSYYKWKTRQRPPKSVTYAYGGDTVLTDSVIKNLREREGIIYATNLSADGTNDAEIWKQLLTPPTQKKKDVKDSNGHTVIDKRGRPKQVPARNHVTVRNAELISDWSKLGSLIDLAGVSACLGSVETSFTAPVGKSYSCFRGHKITKDNLYIERKNDYEVRWCKQCKTAMDLLNTRADQVECASPRTATQERDCLKLVAEWSQTGELSARMILDAAQWSPMFARQIIDKLYLLNLPVTKSTLETVRSTRTEDDFEQALRDRKTSKAASLIRNVPIKDVPRIVGRLDKWLGEVIRASTMAKTESNVMTVGRTLNIDYIHAKELLHYAVKYDKKAIVTATLALAEADRSWFAGQRIGVLETLVASW